MRAVFGCANSSPGVSPCKNNRGSVMQEHKKKQQLLLKLGNVASKGSFLNKSE